MKKLLKNTEYYSYYPIVPIESPANETCRRHQIHLLKIFQGQYDNLQIPTLLTTQHPLYKITLLITWHLLYKITLIKISRNIFCVIIILKIQCDPFLPRRATLSIHSYCCFIRRIYSTNLMRSTHPTKVAWLMISPTMKKP